MALDRLTKVDGGGISTTSDYRVGIITATKFVGPIEGDVTGAITATDGTFSGNVSIAGTLTYEDVTNIDSVGIITAQKDIHVGAGVSVVGVGTFGSLDISGNIDVDGHTNLDNVSIAGVSTFTGQLNAGAVEVNSTINVIGESTFRDRIQLVDGTPEILLSVPSGGLDSRILNDGSGNLIIGHGINSDTPTERLRIASTGNVTIHKDLDVDGHTNLDNVSIAGVSTHSDHIHLLDDKRLRLGSAVNGDAVLLHNGTDTILDNQTGGLLLRSGTHKLQALNANDMIVGNTGGSVELYHNNLRKLSTTSTGIEIHANEANNANIYMTADEGDDNGDEWILQSQASTNNFNFYNNTSGSAAVKLSIKPNGDVGFTGDLLVPENITHSGDTNTRIRFPANDTISFETAGDERLRIQSDGTVRFYNSIFGGDNKPIYLGNANDLSLFHDSGGASIIRYNHSVGGLHFRNNSNADQMIIDSSGNVDIATGQLTISNDIKSSDDDFYVYSYKGGNDGQVRSGIQYDGNSQRLRFFTGTNERIRITSTGNLEKLTGGSYFAYNSNGYYAKQDNYDTNGGKSYWYDGGSGNNNIVASIDGQTGDISAKGNIKILTAGKGIDFSATGDGSGSMSNELLNDYEEGTWTPSGFCDGGSLNVSGAAYTKIGQVVYIYMYISSMDIPNTACNFKIYGLPYTVTNSNSHFPALAIGYSQSGNLPAEIRFLCRANQTYIYSHTTAGNSDQRTNQHIRAYLQSQSLILTGYYFTDS